MASKRTTIVAGTILGGIVLLGTAGLAFAQDPTPSPTPAPSSGGWSNMMNGSGMMSGTGMMGGSGTTSGTGMMGGSGTTSGTGMMGGSGTTNGSGMMGGSGTTNGSGMMGGSGMDADDMAAMHQAMTQSGACDPKLMQSYHDNVDPSPNASPRS